MTVKKKIIIDVDTKGAEKDIKKLDKGVKDTAKSSKGAQKGLGGMSGMTKKLGGAFKALGIGLIISAFMALKKLFSGNMETARKFEKAGAKLSAMFDVLRDRLEPLFEKLMSVFTDPKQAIKDLWEAIKKNLVNRVKGLIETMKAFGKVVKSVFTFDWDGVKEGAKDYGQALIQVTTGMDKEQQKGFIDGIKDIGKEMKEEGNAASDLTEKLQKVRDAERDMLGVRANANKLIAESRLLAEDDSKSMEERLVALKAAVAEEKRVADLELKIQNDKVDAMQAMIDLGKSSEEDIQELAQERARLTELQTASILKQKRVAAEIGTFTNQIAKEEERIEKERLARIELNLKAKELGLEKTEELTNKELTDLIKKTEKENDIRKKSLDEQRKFTMSKQELEIDAAKTKYEKLLAEAEKYGQDTAELTATYNEQVAAIQKTYDDKAVEENQKVADKKAEVANKRIDQAQQIFGALNAIAQEELNAERNALQEQLDAGLISQEEFDKQSAKIEKESVRREKKNAMLQILIDTAQGVAAAIKAGAGLVFPANLGAIASGVLAVLSGIASAKAVLNKVPGGGGGGGAGSDTQVDTPSLTGSLIPNMEAQTQPILGNEPIQAYVVENDISNAQALQQELNDQSTL